MNARPLRIGHVNWSLGLGGAEQVIIHLARECARRGHTVTVFTLNAPGAFAQPLAEAGVEVVALHKRGRYDPSVLWRLAAEFRNRRLDVVHTHLWGGNLWGRMAGRLAGVPIVVTEHNVDTWKPGYYLTLDRWLAPSASALVAVSEEVRRWYDARGVGRGGWRVIYNGIPVPPMPPARVRTAAHQALGLAERLAVAWIGRFVAAKAPEVFVEAMATVCRALPEVTAVMIGDGPLHAQTQARIERAGLSDRIRLTGLRHDVPELLPGMDALVFSSDREGLSIAMLEAMAVGVPVVATRVGGTPELIEDGRTGLLAPPRDPQALAGRLLALLHDPALAQRIRAAARERVEARFTVERMVDAYEQVYRQLAPGARSASDAPSSRGALDAASAPVPVCLIIDHLGPGGAQRQLIELAKGLPREPWQPIVVSLSAAPSAGIDELRRAGVAVHSLPQSGALDLRCLSSLIWLLRRLRPAIVHTWLFTADSYGRVAARVAGLPRVVCAMRNTIDDFTPRQRVANRWLTRWTACVTINAEAIRDGLVRSGVPDEKIVAVPNGIRVPAPVDASRIAGLRAEWRVAPSAPVALMAARLDYQKDHATLIDAAARVAQAMPSAAFVLLGDGPLRRDVESRIEAHGLRDRFRLSGHRGDAREAMAAADLCVLSTHYEGCSNVILEAMAAGRAVVATDVGGNRELVVHSRTGLLVPHADAEALARAMQQLLGDPEQARAMGTRGRERVAEHFSMDAMIARTSAVYQRLLGVAPAAARCAAPTAGASRVG